MLFIQPDSILKEMGNNIAQLQICTTLKDRNPGINFES